LDAKRKFLQDHIVKVVFTRGGVAIVDSIAVSDKTALPFRIEGEITGKRTQIYAVGCMKLPP
jgi:hypothetical protein